MDTVRSWRCQKPRRACEAIARAAKAHHVMPRMVLKGSNEPVCVRARHQAIWELRRLGYSTPLIGRLLGGLHHSTVLYHLRQELPLPPPVCYDAPDESGLWV
jgi:chromosomal replication initiation ATPase DnaA